MQSLGVDRYVTEWNKKILCAMQYLSILGRDEQNFKINFYSIRYLNNLFN